MSTGTDRWVLMVLDLTGESVPMPPPPGAPGRVVRQPWRVPDDDDAEIEREQAAAAVWHELAREGANP
jgi:hypothetical protein